jgi:C-terminal processing protease CtpA/Prc
MIDNCVLGSPAYNSGLISHGDIILRIDGIAATPSNIHELLLGRDKPGSQVLICLSKGGPKVHFVSFRGVEEYLP